MTDTIYSEVKSTINMAEDIDINDHSMLPEITRIKTEVEDPEYDDAVHNVDDEIDDRLYYEPDEEYELEDNLFVNRNMYDKIPKVSEAAHYPQIGNKIILGSKPHPNRNNDLSDEKLHRFKPVVVLEDWGPCLESSPCYCKECDILFATENVFDAHKMIAHSFLVAIGSGASKNIAVKSTAKNQYRNDPLIETLRNKAVKSTTKVVESESFFVNSHKNKAMKSTAKDSKLIVSYDTPRNKALKSTTKSPNASLRNVSTTAVTEINSKVNSKSIISTKQSGKSQIPLDMKLCSHCNQYFHDDDALVKHLYDLLPVKTFNCDKCHKIYNTKAELVTHSLSHTKSKKSENKDICQYAVYKCFVCLCQFVNKKNYRIHMKKNHGILIEKLELQEYNAKCGHCGSINSRLKAFNIHIRKHHSEKCYMKKTQKLLAKDTLKVKIKKPIKKVHSNKLSKHPKSTQFQCLACKEIFFSYFGACCHRKSKHPEMKNQLLFEKSVVQNVKQNLIKKVTDSGYHIPRGYIIENAPIPKSTLFKCDKCPIHFLSCFRTERHSKHCMQSLDGTWKCDVCNRIFSSVERELHQIQHQYASKFKVFVAHAQLRSRILNKCPECEIYFDDIRFWKHRHKGCQKQSKSLNCLECDLQISTIVGAHHKIKHKDLKFSRDDFIKIDFVLTNKTINKSIYRDEHKGDANNKLKRKLSTDSDFEEAPDKRQKIPNVEEKQPRKIRLYYCAFCQCSMQIKKGHKDSAKCRMIASTSCKLCGLTVTQKAYLKHRKLHQLHHIKLNDFEFLRIQDSKITNPMPKYYKCNCNVYFESKQSRLWHKCENVESVTCKVCGKNFSSKAYKFHLSFHEYAKKSQINKPETEEMPEIMKKYESLKKIWNILYLCKTCDTVSDSYDHVVEHCQNHYNNMESYGIVIKHCKICDLKFEVTCFDKHNEIHSGNEQINKQSFTLIQYSHTSLLTDEWMHIFNNLSQEQVEQIISPSIYSTARDVKMKVVQKGLPELTLYKCGKCCNFVDSNSISGHTHDRLCSTDMTNKLYCAVCCIPFFSQKDRSEHVLVHRTPNVNKKSFRIVSFNNENDDQFNRAINSVQPVKCIKGEVDLSFEKNTNEDMQVPSEEQQVPMPKLGKKLYSLYKCTKCDTCIMRLDNISRHVCYKKSYVKKCSECHNYFFRAYLPKHLKSHLIPNYVKANIKVVPFDPQNNSYVKETKKNHSSSNLDKETVSHPKRIVKIYKCDCGLHFTHRNSIDKHLSACKAGYNISKETCSKCGLLFATDVLVSHLCNHHSNDKSTKFDIEEIKAPRRHNSAKYEQNNISMAHKVDNISLSVADNIIYKCVQCNVNYMTASSLRAHSINHENKVEPVACKICSLRFPFVSMKKHMYLHHEKNNFCINDLQFRETYKRTDIVSNESVVNDSTLNASGDASMIDIVENKAYKCSRCEIHFGDSTMLNDHAQRPCNEDSFEICKECNIKFESKCIEAHMKSHHVTQSGNENMAETIHGSTNTKESKSKYTCQLYKCEKCPVHYISQDALAKHLSQGYHSNVYRTCKTCGIAFPPKSLERHEYIHHKIMKLKLEDMHIVDSSQIQGLESKSVPKINIKRIAPRKPQMMNITETIPAFCRNRQNVLYKCDKCHLHFLRIQGLRSHIDSKKHNKGIRLPCEACGLMFPPSSAREHHRIHHKILKLKLENMNIITYSQYFNTIKRKVRCTKVKSVNMTNNKESIENRNGNDINVSALENIQDEIRPNNKNTENILSFDSRKFSGTLDDDKDDNKSILDMSINKIDISSNKVNDSSLNESDALNISFDTSSVAANAKNYQVKLYKCGECNVCYLTQPACYKHTIKHTPLDPMDYIECKFCNLQFPLTILKTHLKKHHSKKLGLEDILIEEYQSKECNSQVPKIDVYCAMDRVQSGQISTTTDANKDVDGTCGHVERSLTVELDLNTSSSNNVSCKNPENISIRDKNEQKDLTFGREVKMVKHPADKINKQDTKMGLLGHDSLNVETRPQEMGDIGQTIKNAGGFQSSTSFGDHKKESVKMSSEMTKGCVENTSEVNTNITAINDILKNYEVAKDQK